MKTALFLMALCLASCNAGFNNTAYITVESDTTNINHNSVLEITLFGFDSRFVQSEYTVLSGQSTSIWTDFFPYLARIDYSWNYIGNNDRISPFFSELDFFIGIYLDVNGDNLLSPGEYMVTTLTQETPGLLSGTYELLPYTNTNILDLRNLDGLSPFIDY